MLLSFHHTVLTDSLLFHMSMLDNELIDWSQIKSNVEDCPHFQMYL